ncbi:hypothetical protein GPECTOR_54g175 [Gonium pectorale]|uniref:PPM-type phosphatase domain-containing protein n=1 Tax=Gonium pectorale TaxID=33097 RepID=A0A150G7B4_GONPE|nr:hypothetical protein GPECTOR_54g175 [Gonium pectorale]|eukprot:KXZ45435.1 hypothetical protein GPECTOR_54g175 [Gonium pectorale]
MEPAGDCNSEKAAEARVASQVKDSGQAGSGGAGRPAAVLRAQPAAPAADAVDEDYIKHLIDQELGPPKFAVRKQEPTVQPLSSSDEHSLQQLLDQAFGPPKFAVPKPPAPAAETEPRAKAQVEAPGDGAMPALATAAESSEAAVVTAPAPQLRLSGMGLGHGHGVKRSAPEAAAGALPAADVCGDAAASLSLRPPVLAMTATHGPAAGRSFVADDPSQEYKIGRLPDCFFQILDQEISGRHASLRWDGDAKQWKLHDVGSLNGTSVSGKAIGRDYKVQGDEVPLADGATVELGTVTRLRVALREASGGSGAGAAGAGAQDAAAGSGAKPSSPVDAAAVAAPAKRQHTSDGRPPSSGDIAGRGVAGLATETLSGLGGLGGALPNPTALVELPELRARLCVHNRLGVDHKRMNQGCEDVPYWELPFGPYTGAGILCVFDGHHGSKAAQQAREHLPAILRAKLLSRDGRQAPPLPPPPPPRPPRMAEDDEAEMEQDTFLAADKYMSMEEGCTATLVLVEADPQDGGWLLQSANVGDSSAVLVNLTRGNWVKLSEDHRIASSVSERQRLAARGHTVRTRLYGLNISRMLGDRFLKEEDLGFLAEPHVSGMAQVAAGESALLVVASDGLWDVLPEERAAKLLLQEAAKGGVGTSGPSLGCQGAADLLLAHALVLRSKDDITIAVMELGCAAATGTSAAGALAAAPAAPH